jgi:hypothetical protein
MILEDGTGKPDANSYAALEEADAYHTERGNADWAGASADAREASLVRACDYLERTYGRLWTGRKYHEHQRLSFPRIAADGIPEGEIPFWLKEAQSEAALLELTEPGILAADPSGGGSLLRECEGELVRSYAAGAPSPRRFPHIHHLVAGYIRNPAQIETGRI